MAHHVRPVQIIARLSILLATLSFAQMAKADGLDLKASEIRGDSSKKPVSVLQNRFFLKALRPEVGILAGSMLNEAYTDTKSFGARAGVFATEWLGFEVQAIRTNVSDTADRKALNRLKYRPLEDPTAATRAGEEVIVSPDPEINAIHGMTDVAVIAAPFYGKLNLMNKLIVYSDLYLTGGISRVETDQGDKTALIIGGGQRFYLYESWSLRIDVRDRIYTETRAGEKTRKNAVGFDIGASYFFL
jgi:outer membrane beta-barrel protein